MSDTLSFDRSEPLSATGAEWLRPTVRRIIAPNGGPFTFTGTCSYLVGTKTLAVIDPGPDDARHLEALLAAIGNVVAVEVRQRAIAALAVVDDAVVVAVGRPFDDVGSRKSPNLTRNVARKIVPLTTP